MRAGEICALRKGDVNCAVARLHMTKNGSPHDVALSPRALELWKMAPDGFGAPRHYSTLYFVWQDTRDDADFHVAATEYVVKLVSIWFGGNLAEAGQERSFNVAGPTYFSATFD